ncbi:MAG: FAD-binding protein, partial [Xanthobacteraceae bacterium]
MTDTIKPRDDNDVEDAVRWAVAEAKSLEIMGQGSKRAIGRPAQSDCTLDLSALAGVTLYEPEELVLTARAGTPLAEIEALVASRDQQLAFEPMDYASVLGGIAGSGTLGGAIAANLSGPRRIKSGAARDHFLGFTAVSGRAESFKSGGRVVKNVTGYDLCKLMAGSWGTLAVLTEITIKTLPRPQTEATVALLGLDDAAAVAAMSAAMGSPCEVSGAAHLPVSAGERIPLGGAVASGRALTLLRLEGVPPSVAHRKAMLLDIVRPLGAVADIDGIASHTLWRDIRDVMPFAASRSGAEQSLWRVSTAPGRGAELARMIAGSAPCDVLYDWAGG